jgi:hypothetical protein
MLRRWWLSGAVVVVCSSMLLARQGVVRTDDGRVIEGDITQSVNDDLVTITIGTGQVTVPRSDVLSIIYGDDIAKEFTERLRELPAADIRDRLELGQWALDKNQYDLARQAANGVLRIDPGNVDAMTLLGTIQGQQALAERESAAAAAAAQPQNPTPTTEPTPPSPQAPSIYLSDDQINRIRQFELRPDDAVRVAFDPDVRQRYVAQTGDDPQTFAALEPTAQAQFILSRGDPTLTAGVKILSDPESLDDFRRRIQIRILVGCSASGCHGGDTPAGDFGLFTDASQVPAAYTNFYILQQYRLKIDSPKTVWGSGPVEWRMIDRTHPAQSLLIQYGLPREAAQLPHPDVPGWRAMFAGEQDPDYADMLQWIGQTLKSMDPDYGFHFPLLTGPTAATQPANP